MIKMTIRLKRAHGSRMSWFKTINMKAAATSMLVSQITITTISSEAVQVVRMIVDPGMVVMLTTIATTIVTKGQARALTATMPVEMAAMSHHTRPGIGSGQQQHCVKLMSLISMTWRIKTQRLCMQSRSLERLSFRMILPCCRMQNFHMMNDSDRITLEAFMKQYSILGIPSYADSVVSTTEAWAVGQKPTAGPSRGASARTVSEVKLASASTSTAPACPSALKKAPEGTGINPQRAKGCLMAHCSVCSALCPELDMLFTFLCENCDSWFERLYLAKAVNQVTKDDRDRMAQVRKRAKESCMITAEDVVIKHKNLVRTLTLHVQASKELALPSLNGMPSEQDS